MSPANPHSTTIGVYLITNTITGAVYVGSTSTSIKRRWKEHRLTLRKGVHPNPHLQYAWDAYGEESFTFTLVEAVTEPSEVIAREQEWLDQYFPLGPRQCYNMKPTADSMYGFKQRPETIARRVAKMLGRKNTEETRQRMSEARKGLVYSEEHLKIYSGFSAPDGTEYRNIIGLQRFCDAHGLDCSNMYKLAVGKYRSVKGWKRLEERW